MSQENSQTLSFKKCINCGKISKWNLSDNDRCEHCNAYLVSRELIEKREKNILEENTDVLARWGFIERKQDDPVLVRFLKEVGWRIQIILTAILSFFVWLIATLAG